MKRAYYPMGLLLLALGAGEVCAGYESVPAPKDVRKPNGQGSLVASSLVDRKAWVGGVVLADGREMVLENGGGYFLSIDLEPGAKCQMWFSGSGLVPGRPVTLLCLHGGAINGKIQDTVAVGEGGILRFEYANGTFGAQPIQASIFGNAETLLTVKAKTAEKSMSEDEGDHEAQ